RDIGDLVKEQVLMNKYFVYILASKRNGTLYISATNDLEKRIFEHKNKIFKGFTQKYNVTQLVYFEEFDNSDETFTRERRLKKWNRAWKLILIEKENPRWKYISEEWV
ncbi:MAG: GIY-YIG nuclease family protein, partial [Vicingaceae bacterium]